MQKWTANGTDRRDMADLCSQCCKIMYNTWVISRSFKLAYTLGLLYTPCRKVRLVPLVS